MIARIAFQRNYQGKKIKIHKKVAQVGCTGPLKIQTLKGGGLGVVEVV